MKGIVPFFGIKSPERKVMEREFFTGDVRAAWPDDDGGIGIGALGALA